MHRSMAIVHDLNNPEPPIRVSAAPRDASHMHGNIIEVVKLRTICMHHTTCACVCIHLRASFNEVVDCNT